IEKVESWLDEHPQFVHDYFVRKASRQMVESWLHSHSTPHDKIRGYPKISNIPVLMLLMQVHPEHDFRRHPDFHVPLALPGDTLPFITAPAITLCGRPRNCSLWTSESSSSNWSGTSTPTSIPQPLP
ncbi:hypothetical protein CEXT_802931, partial [Caerostris extrusa]